MLVTLLLGCGAGAPGATVPRQIPDTAPGCLTIPAEDNSLMLCAAIDAGNFGTLSETLQGFMFEPETESALDSAETAFVSADVAPNKPWLRGPEPPALVLFVSGLAFIAFSKWRRRRFATRRLRQRVDYAIRQMA